MPEPSSFLCAVARAWALAPENSDEEATLDLVFTELLVRERLSPEEHGKLIDEALDEANVIEAEQGAKVSA